MKRYLLFSLVILSISTLSLSAGTKIKASKLPAAAIQFIEKHFSGTAIMKVSRDKDSYEYEVELTDGTEIEFDSLGQWQKIEIEDPNSLPQAILPDTVYKFAAFKYPGISIVETKKVGVGYEVEMANDAEMIFSNTGKFLRKSK